jgi:hypothetical protein
LHLLFLGVAPGPSCALIGPATASPFDKLSLGAADQDACRENQGTAERYLHRG